jgi:FlaA1/EpsC-like NDP-sugar epimerase
VDTVFAALRGAKRGETYIPNAPSTSIMNIANALIGDRPLEIKIAGIRPGEKIHEIMVSEEEAHHCVKRGDYYAILPMLPELLDGEERKTNVLQKEFSSADRVLNLQQTIDLLHQHRLMVEDGDSSQGEELLR